MNDLDKRAKALYDAVPTPKPTWDQLGDTTKSVWREEAVKAKPAQTSTIRTSRPARRAP